MSGLHLVRPFTPMSVLRRVSKQMDKLLEVVKTLNERVGVLESKLAAAELKARYPHLDPND